MYTAVLADGAPLDGVVVNAGIWVEEDVPLHTMTLAQWEGTLAADLTSAFLTCRGFLRHLAALPRDDASIVLVASTAGLFGEAGHADYAAAKAAMAHGLTASLKNEIVALAPRGRVNCVCPGWVRTPMAEPALADPATLEHATATMALRKVAEPEDVARAVVYLSSAALSGHVSGTILPVAGGMEGRLLWR
jgi:NAD(P)-dependent dehydrogenase (short-subunit alcohol dehydrogenase family)